MGHIKIKIWCNGHSYQVRVEDVETKAEFSLKLEQLNEWLKLNKYTHLGNDEFRRKHYRTKPPMDIESLEKALPIVEADVNGGYRPRSTVEC